MKVTLRFLSNAILLASAAGCTGQLPGSFRLAQQEQTFSSQLQINTKIDLLWVVDNSSSMDVSQERLRNGFSSFAAKYMQPTWDIRVAVITTDTYMANPTFGTFLNQVVPGTTGWGSPHINSRLATFQNPASNPTLVNLTTGKFDNGVRYQDLIPAWAAGFSRLLPGLHDGPVAALCSEVLPYFILGVTQCAIRDDQASYSGSDHCLRPDTANGESPLTQCVNTVQNDTIRSGKAIISTLGRSPAALTDDFIINVTTGSAGHGSERGLGSVLQLLSDNEPTNTAFFRPDSLRGIVFVSDEDDQTLQLPEASTVTPSFSPWTNYKCDQAGLIAANGNPAVTGNNGACCTDPAKNCRYGSEGTSCAPKTVDGFTYTVSFCPRTDRLMPVADVKDKIDSFFKTLDGAGSTNPNYFVASIVALTGSAIQSLQAVRTHDDNQVGALRTVAVDRGDRYIELGDLVGNGSMAMNIAENDYTPILDAIGRNIIEKKSTFTLARVPTGSEDMTVTVAHVDGSVTIIGSDKFVIQGNTLVITDQAMVLGFAATDSITINYQPKSVTDRN